MEQWRGAFRRPYTCELVNKPKFGTFLNYVPGTLRWQPRQFLPTRNCVVRLVHSQSSPSQSQIRILRRPAHRQLALGSWSDSSTTHIHEASNCDSVSSDDVYAHHSTGQPYNLSKHYFLKPKIWVTVWPLAKHAVRRCSDSFFSRDSGFDDSHSATDQT